MLQQRHRPYLIQTFKNMGYEVAEIVESNMRPYFLMVSPFHQTVQRSSGVPIAVDESPRRLAEIERMCVGACDQSKTDLWHPAIYVY